MTQMGHGGLVELNGYLYCTISLFLVCNDRGVVAVSMDMLQMDINQCDDDYFIPNAFKGTHKCDRKTSYVSVFVAGSVLWYPSQFTQN